jgi:isoquinoline 1-oxidoreductase beta subunit
MWWRSVYASTNAFAFESFFDELAAKAGVDPLDLRRSHLPDERMQAVLDKLAETSGWRSRKPKSGYGMAFSESFGSLVGEVVKVSRGNDGKVNIDKVWVVIDCGWYVNPDTIRAQVEGSVVMALGAAAMHEIRFKDGMAQQPNFSSYPMPRINNVPPVEVHIMENHHDAGGVGEPALPPFAAALTNAVYDLTGKRIRKLPFDLNAL